jgi:hypothetical protein
VKVSHFQPSLIFWGKSGSQSLELNFIRGSTLVSFSFDCKCFSRVDVTDIHKPFSLSRYGKKCRKKFYSTGPQVSMSYNFLLHKRCSDRITQSVSVCLYFHPNLIFAIRQRVEYCTVLHSRRPLSLLASTKLVRKWLFKLCRA